MAYFVSWTTQSIGEKREPNLFMFTKRNKVNLYDPSRGRGIVRFPDDDAGIGDQKKQTPYCNGMDTRVFSRHESVQTSDWSLIAR